MELIFAEPILNQELLYRWTEHLAELLFLNPNWGMEKGPQSTTPVSIFWIMIFYNLKKFRSTNEGSIFILSSLEVGHCAAQTQAFFANNLKLHSLASYNNLRIEQDSEFAKI